MKVVIQRVKYASCVVDNQMVSKIDQGLLCLVGFTHEDNMDILKKLSDKLLGLRIFEDENGKMNKSLQDIQGEIMLISQFTLYADCKKGRRPSFTDAMEPNFADELYRNMLEYISNSGFKVLGGVFQADMKIELLNDGPCTIVLDSKELI